MKAFHLVSYFFFLSVPKLLLFKLFRSWVSLCFHCFELQNARKALMNPIKVLSKFSVVPEINRIFFIMSHTH